MESDSPMKKVVRERSVGRAVLYRMLEELESRDVAGGITLYASKGRFRECLSPLIEGNDQRLEELEQLTSRAEKSETGAVTFWSTGSPYSGLAVLPPFPVEQDQLLAGWDASPLRAMLDREYLLGVVLLRLGRYAVGVFRGETLLTSKTDTRYVKGRHSAGGTSQKRFERIREKQVQEIFQKTCTVAKQQISPFEDQLDYILLGGERFTLQGFLKRCDYLRGLSAKVLGRTLNVREPKRVALEGVINTIWESRVLSFS